MNAMKPALFVALISTLVGCEAQLVCEVCTGEHSTESHIDAAAQSTGGTPDVSSMFSDDVLLAFVARHRSDGFIRVNAEPYESEVSDAKLNVYVSEFALAEYLEIAPDLTESDGMIPRGSFIIRELVDANGDVSKLTALYRGPEDYNPASGDFWFAVTDPEGNVLPNAAGEPMAGPIQSCSSCHAGRADADYLFGVPGHARFTEFGKPTEEPAPQQEDPTSEPEENPTSEPSEPSPTSGPEPEPEPAPTVLRVDLGGWVLANVEEALSREQSATLDSLEVPVGSNVVIARDATRQEFEQYWGALPADTVFVNQAQSSSFGAPIVNGGEMWELRNESGATLDDTPAGEAGASYARASMAGSWTEHAAAEATPGLVDIALPGGVWLTEWSDADDYHVEFVELAVR